MVIRHASGALSSLVSSHAVQGHRCPGLELYGTEGPVSLIGDDWDPRGVELLTSADGSWRTWSPPDTSTTEADLPKSSVEAR